MSPELYLLATESLRNSRGILDTLMESIKTIQTVTNDPKLEMIRMLTDSLISTQTILLAVVTSLGAEKIQAAEEQTNYQPESTQP